MTIRKITTLLILSVLPLGVLTAQDQKEEKNYLPKAGDWAIGVDMRPIYGFIGNMFADGNGALNGLRQFGGESPENNMLSIMGKFMLDKTIALRLNVGINNNVSNRFQYVRDDEARFLNPLSEADVKDCNHSYIADYSVAAGIEFRRGKERLQGYGGADLLFFMTNRHYQFSYGNAISEINQTPTRTNYNGIGLGGYNPGYWTAAYAKESYLKNYKIGLVGRLGIEYFIAPKLAMGGEVSLVFSEQFDLGSWTKSEGFNTTTDVVEQHTELIAPTSRVFHIGTEDMGGKLFMLFYF